MKKHLGSTIDAYTRHDDRIRLLVDADGDGTADDSRVFADRFNGILDGTGAGVLAHRDTVYYTNIPRLYALKDGDGDGRSDDRAVLSEGYGVRFAYRGHDMHGLVIGPDARLYFSIGDRGLDVRQGDRHWLFSETGDLILARLTPKAYEELGRVHLLDPTGECFGREVVWSHPAFAGRCVFARNDRELVCVSLAEEVWTTEGRGERQQSTSGHDCRRVGEFGRHVGQSTRCFSLNVY
jgi:hypothetical protein